MNEAREQLTRTFAFGECLTPFILTVGACDGDVGRGS